MVIGGDCCNIVDKLIANSYHLFCMFSSAIRLINLLIPLSIVKSILSLLNVMIDVFNSLTIVDRSATTGAATAETFCDPPFCTQLFQNST